MMNSPLQPIKNPRNANASHARLPPGLSTIASEAGNAYRTPGHFRGQSDPGGVRTAERRSRGNLTVSGIAERCVSRQGYGDFRFGMRNQAEKRSSNEVDVGGRLWGANDENRIFSKGLNPRINRLVSGQMAGPGRAPSSIPFAGLLSRSRYRSWQSMSQTAIRIGSDFAIALGFQLKSPTHELGAVSNHSYLRNPG